MSGTAGGPRRKRSFNPDRDVEEWHGKYVPYDLVKEFIIALVVVSVLVVGLAVVLSSPDEHPVTIKSWSTSDPVDFAQTAITELDGTSGTATYGPPYNSTPGSSQSIGPFSPESWFGVHHPIDTADDYVIEPLRTLPGNPSLQQAVNHYTAASSAQQAQWTAAYETAVAKATDPHGVLSVPSGRYGPVGPMITGLTTMARSGALDGALLSRGSSTGPTTPSPCCSSPTEPIWAIWPRARTCRAPSGG